MADVATAPAPAAPPAPPASPPPGAPAAAGSAGSPDPYKDAQAQADANARATLRALSTAGTAGTAQYAQAQAANTADKGAAISNLLGSAMFKGIPGQSVGTPASATPAPGIVGQAFDQRLASTGLLGDAFNAAMGTRETGAQRYFDEAKGAIPVIKAQTDQRIELAHERAQAAHDAAQARAQQQAQSFAMSMALKQMGLDAAQARAAKANAPQTPGQIIAALGGPDLAGDVIGQAGRQAFNDQPLAPLDGGFDMTAPEGFQPSGGVDIVGSRLGLPSGYGQQLVANSDRTDALQARQDSKQPALSGTALTQAIRNQSDYPAALKEAINGLTGANPAKGTSQTGTTNYIATKYGVPMSAAIQIVNDALSNLTAAQKKALTP